MPPGHEHAGVTALPGKRHENLPEAVARLAELGRLVSDFVRILAVIRNPYDIEVSRFHYWQRGHPWDRGPLQDLAMAGNFDRFVRESLYPYIRAPVPIESFYTIDGEMPANMRLLRQERLATDLAHALAGICEITQPLTYVNTTKHAHWRDYVTRDNEPYIFTKYRWLFQFYERATF